MWRHGLILVSMAWGSALLPSAWGGEVRGQIVISRALTKKRVAVPNYQMRGPAVSAPLAAPANEYSRIVIYLESVSAAAPAPVPTPVTVTLTQEHQRFDPEIVVIPLGSTVSFPNSDPIFHNVFSLSPPRQFDLGYYPAGEARKLKFDKPGIVQVYCHLHPDMSAAIVVAPTAWYLRPDERGWFSFPSLPAGAYQVVVWHKSAGFFRHRVEVTADGVANLSIELPIQEAAIK